MKPYLRKPLFALRAKRDAVAEDLADQLLYRRDPRIVQKDIDALCWRDASWREVGISWRDAFDRLRRLCHDDYERDELDILKALVDEIHRIEEQECAELIACHGRVA
jgi:hypothetical protein